jgi:hypothetical protein
MNIIAFRLKQIMRVSEQCKQSRGLSFLILFALLILLLPLHRLRSFYFCFFCLVVSRQDRSTKNCWRLVFYVVRAALEKSRLLFLPRPFCFKLFLWLGSRRYRDEMRSYTSDHENISSYFIINCTCYN